MSNQAEAESLDGIAIIGLACRFPGARNIEEFWQNIKNGVESISVFSDQELLESGVEPALLRNPSYVRASATLEDIDRFDATFFGFNRREAEVLDPQQRLFLECAYTALEHAGYDSERYEGLIGVYAGVGANGYVYNLLENRELVAALGEYQIALANEKDFLATRLAYKLNLRGPSATVQTACSTSLVATHLACQSLLSFDCDLALVGGSAINVPHKVGYLYREGGIASPDGHCRAFDAQAAGTVSGSGVGAVVLKRLADALADGDSVYVVIKSSAINNDGAVKVGFTAPSQDGQAAVITQALALAGIDPSTIGYIEAHGTGTTLGDPIEVAALNQVFRGATDERGFCAIGSVKTNIGHLDAASGMAGLIKTTLALTHRQIPPSLHFTEPNPKIDFADSPFYVATQLSDWQAAGHPRRAGVSSFGIGGTNAHVILEEAPPAAPSGARRPAQLLLLSAKTRSALDTMTANLAEHLKRNPQLDLADVAYSLQTGRRVFGQRRILACRDIDEAVAALTTLDPKSVFSAAHQPADRPIVFMFPGQGAQHSQMAAELYCAEPIFREQLDRCAELLMPQLGRDIRELLYPHDDGRTTEDEGSDSSSVLRPSSDAAAAELLNQTQYTQPALFAVEYALAQLWMSWGITPRAMIGHSLGEYVAATLAGVFSLEDALALVAARGRLIQQLPGGAMLAVYLPESELRPLLSEQLALAAVNGPALCVVAGPAEAVAELAQQLAERGAEARSLHVSHAFHSAMMDAILEPYTALVAKIDLQAPQIPYISNVTGGWISAAEATDPRYWARQIRQTVRFNDGLHALFADPKRLLLEVGPGQTLSTLARRHPDKPGEQTVLASLRRPNDRLADDTTVLGALGQLWLAGSAVDWTAFYSDQRRTRLPLPTYPFERERYWIAAAQEGFGGAASPQDAYTYARPSGPGGKNSETPLSVTPMEILMPETHSISAAPARHEQILATLGVLINRLTGATLDEISPAASVFDIGFDSLILIQFSQAIQDELGVKISLVQLLEQYNTLDSIAAFLDRALPPDRLPTPAQPAAQVAAPAQPAVATVPQAPAQSAGVPAPQATAQLAVAPAPQYVAPAPVQQYVAPAPAAPRYEPVQAATQPGDALERIMSQQIQLLASQLDVLRGGAGQPVTAPAQLAAPQPSAQPIAVAPITQAESIVPVTPMAASDTRKVRPAPFVPYHPAEIAVNNDMTSRQREYLAAFIERYTARTQGSKRLTQTYRPVLADSRSTVAFRLAWKELVYPIIGKRSEGSRIWDVDGNEYIDVTMGFGVHLFGHSPRFVMDAMAEQMKIGVQLGPQSYLAGEVARLICELTGAERANFCNSGTEAVMGAMRIARTVTRRSLIACFAESYHGWSDATMARPVLRNGELKTVPMAPGVMKGAVEDMLVLEYDNPQSLEILKAHAHELAGVMVEPVQSRRPDLQPRAFLHALREFTTQAGIPLIFDEMVNGFRILPGGAQEWFGVQADIITYGKIVGGGLPIGIIAGKAAYMDAFDGGMWNYGDGSYPEAEKTLFAGAFFKHPLTMAAALAVLNHIQANGSAMYEQLNQRTTSLVERLNAFFEQQQVPIQVVHFSSIFRFNLAPEAKYLDLFFYHLIEKGIYIWEGINFYLSTAHTDADLERFFAVVKESIADLRSGGFLPELPPDASSGEQGSGGISRRPIPTPVAASTNGNGHHVSAVLAAPTAASAPIVSAAPANRVRRSTGKANAQPQFSLYYFGNYEAAFKPGKYDLLFDGARFADANGFAAVWIPERHFHPFGGFSPNPSVVAAALARETQHIQLRAGSVALPLHHPIRVAEEWSVVDNLSNGRVGISFASGWHPDDFVFAPDAYERRRDIMLEGIETVQKLWRGEGVLVRGGAQSQMHAKLFPMPRQPELPFWLTCVQKETFVKAGAIGAGVLTNLLDQSIEELTEKIALYREALAQHGHPAQAGHVTVLVHTFLAETTEAAVQQARQPFYGYLKSSLGLVRNMAKSQGRQVDLERLSEEELHYLLADAYERIVQTGALIGTTESCAPLVATLAASGVDEIACLIDFGVDAAAVLDSLQHVRALKDHPSEPIGDAGERPAMAPAATPAAPLTFPLTEPQKGLWVLAQLGNTEARLYNEALALRLRGPLRIAELRQALQQVVNRHEALRTIFSADGDYQQVLPELMIDLPLSDVADLADAERTAQTDALLANEVEQAFDLANGPLLRARLIKIQDQEHLLALTLHHIITDGWSIDIILQELAALYTAACQGTSAQLAAPKQFRDYVAWLDRQEHSSAGGDAERYWLDRFAGTIPTLELPTDHQRRPARTFAGAQTTLMIDPALGGQLRQFSTKQGCTLFTTLLAGFTTLLHRLSGQDDLVVGVPAAGQLALGDSYLAGYCLNLLPLRSSIAGDIPFAKHLTNVRRMVLEAYENQTFSFGTLVKKLQLERDLSRSPLVSVVFNLEKGSHESTLTFFDLETEAFPRFSGLARFDINVNVFDNDGIISLQCDYSTDLFDATTIQRWLEHFQIVLANIIADPAQTAGAVSLLSAADQAELLIARNATAAAYPADRSFHQLFEEQAARTPNAVAVVFGEQRLTYRELDQRANQLAHYLRGLGVGPDARVGVCFARSLELVVGLLGIFKAGGAFVPLDPAFPQERMAYILDDAQVQVLLVATQDAEGVQPVVIGPSSFVGRVVDLVADWPQIARASAEALDSGTSADNLAYLIYTSGSTGRPKGVLIPQRGLVNYLAWCVEAYGAASGRGAPVHASIAADAIFPSLFAPLLAGTSVVIMPNEQPLEALGDALQQDEPFSMVKITPSQLEVLNQQMPWEHAGALVHTLVVGAEEVRGEVLTDWQRYAPATILLNEYGPTETVVGCSIYRVPSGQPIAGTVPIGLPIANTQFYVLDAQMQPVPIGVPGELYIGGDGVAWGYHNRPDLTAERFVPNPFSDCRLQIADCRLDDPTIDYRLSAIGYRLYRTGDLVRYLADRAGNIEFLGRIDDQVKIRGYRVEPGEVAAALVQHAEVCEAVVLAREDVPGQRRLVAYVVTTNDERRTTNDEECDPSFALRPSSFVQELRAFLAARLPEYMLPAAYVFLKAIPLAPHGKIDRKALPAPDTARPELATSFTAPRTPVEQQIADIWCQLLNVEQVGVYDNFFELGGDSLLAVRLISRLRDAFQVELSARVLFEKPLIADLADVLAHDLAEDADDDLVAQLLAELETLSEEDAANMLATA
jgi:natural product biosynthesis luciferase-like monooxygenase protein/amino acid adenylation domain-containing protein